MPCYSQEDPVQQEDTPDDKAETFDLYLTSPDITALIFREVTPRTPPLFHQIRRQLSWLVLWLLMWSFPTTALFHNVEFPNHAYYGVCGPGDRLPPSNLQYFNSSYGLPMEHGQSKLQKKPAEEMGGDPMV